MNIEELEKGLELNRDIHYLKDKIDYLEKKKVDYKKDGFIELGEKTLFNNAIRLPYEVFKGWLDEQIIEAHNKKVDLELEFEEL